MLYSETQLNNKKQITLCNSLTLNTKRTVEFGLLHFLVGFGKNAIKVKRTSFKTACFINQGLHLNKVAMDLNQSMQHLPGPSEHLIFIDDMMADLPVESGSNLYLQLIKDPPLLKKEFSKYHYKPCPDVPRQEIPIPLKEAQEQGLNIEILDKIPKCNCSKTKCQKNYCECFRAGLACGLQCSCVGCRNDQALGAYLKKTNLGPTCKCQKSNCNKNYCQCHNSGRFCSSQCKCTQCLNVRTSLPKEKPIQKRKRAKKVTKTRKQCGPISIRDDKSKKKSENVHKLEPTI